MTLDRGVIAMSEFDMAYHVRAPEGWGAYLEGFDTWLVAANQPLSTRKLRNYHLRRFAATCGAASPREVTADMVIQHLSNARWKGATKNSVRASLRGFFTWAVDTGQVSRNPTQVAPKARSVPGLPRPASEAAIERGLEAADDRVGLMIRLGANLGLRCCEIAKVHADDVVLVGVKLRLRVVGKGGRHRMLPITRLFAEELLERAAGGYVFPGQEDGHLSAAYVSKLISRALPEGVTAHMLRHRFGTEVWNAHRNIRAAQILLGHASVSTTQIYTHVDDDELELAAAAAA